MIKINTSEKYEYELNGETKEMDYPSVFDLAEYQEKLEDLKPHQQLIASKDFLLKLGMDKVAVKHLKAHHITDILKSFSEGN